MKILSIGATMFVAAVAAMLAGVPAHAQSGGGQIKENNGTFRSRAPVAAPDRLIVKYRARAASTARTDALNRASAAAGVRMRSMRQISPDLELTQLDAPLNERDLQTAIARLQAQPDVEYAVPDYRRQVQRIPSDALYTGQWFLQGVQPAAIRADTAWDATVGSGGTVVAVIDTGARFDHPDLATAASGGKLLPGYDFVSADSGGGFLRANDGNGRDSDASDPGDWIDTADRQKTLFSDCDQTNSSWHGTRVSGLIGARSDNGIGVTGIGWSTWVLPVRALGKCGGFDSDIIAAMRWAAGLSVSGVPDNPYPARVINLSLGSVGSCSSAYQSLIDQLTGMGVLVVASAGNEGGPVGSPANCRGVMAVAGLRHVGTKVGFSDLGPEIGIGAPGGNCVNSSGACLFSIDTTTDTGSTTPVGAGYTSQFNINVGTSFSSPIVAGVAALMHAANARLSPAALIARMKQSARPFPTTSTTTTTVCRVPASSTDIQDTECICTTGTCGAGMLDAAQSVAAAQRPAVSITLPGSVSAGQTIALSGTNSGAACGRTISTYSWTVVSGTAVIATPAQSAINVQAPTSGNFVLRLTVTDDQGAQDSADVTVTTNSSSTTALPLLSGSACPTPLTITPTTPTTPTLPAADDDDGGGGGALGIEWLLLAVGLRRIARRR